jgi:hypothetical protein
MQLLASPSIRERIIASRDQGAAAEMMLKPSSGLSPRAVMDDARLAWEGRVAPLLLWDKHPQALILAGLLSLILVAWMGRLLRPRRTVQTPSTGA